MSHIHTYQDYSRIYKVMLSVGTGKSFLSFVCEKRQHSKTKSETFYSLLPSLCFLIISHVIFTADELDLTCRRSLYLNNLMKSH